MQRAVELAVAASVEAVADRLTGRGRNWRAAGETCEGGLTADAAGVGPGEQQLRRCEWANAGLVEQLRCELAGQDCDLGFEVTLLVGELFDPAGERAQGLECAAQLNVGVT